MKELLKLIETVSPDDTAKLDEIDARVGCLITDTEYQEQFKYPLCSFERRDGSFADSYVFPRYTRSRDALKAIRPEGWNIQHHQYDAGKHHVFGLTDYSVPKQCYSPRLPTEELAELHAIIQAIAYERSQQSEAA